MKNSSDGPWTELSMESHHAMDSRFYASQANEQDSLSSSDFRIDEKGGSQVQLTLRLEQEESSRDSIGQLQLLSSYAQVKESAYQSQ